MPFLHAQQPLSRDGLIGPLDLHQLAFAQGRRAINQPLGGRREHHPARRSNRFHPLSHLHLLTDGGVTEWAGTDFTGDHLARVQAHPQQEVMSRSRTSTASRFASSCMPNAARQARKA